MSKITYNDKENARTTATPDTQKVTAEDMNELKDSINKLYNIFGWAVYRDTGADFVINTTEKLLTIDKNSVTETYLPLEIRETGGTLFAGNAITPISVGDSYDLRLDIEIVSKTGNPQKIFVKLDIGGSDVTPTNTILNSPIPGNIIDSFSVPLGIIFVGSTFLANGGRLFVSTDTGTVTINSRLLFIKRDFSEL